MFLLLLFNC